MKSFVFTSGDINGIGPEIVIKTVSELIKSTSHQFILTFPGNVLELLCNTYEITFPIEKIHHRADLSRTTARLVNYDIGNYSITPGEPTATSGEAAYKSIISGFDLVNSGFADSLITAPISKVAIKMAGYNIPGHTELLTQLCEIDKSVMTFLSSSMRCALVTIHEPIKNVPELLTPERLKNTLDIVVNTCKVDLGIDNPNIAVLGLNPHAGENGNIGTEEVDIITPVIEQYPNIEIDGPFVPDAFFGRKLYRHYDFFIAMYHDQALIPFKMLNFSTGVNYTAGLPIIRTSPDHGTAFDIAWMNKADHLSLYEAYMWADKIVDSRKSYYE